MNGSSLDAWLNSQNNNGGTQAKMPNGTPVAVDYDSLSIAERATLQPAAWEHAQISVSGGGHGLGNFTSVKVYNGSHSHNPTVSNGTGKSTFMLVVAMIVLGFILYAIVTGGGQ